MRIRHLNNFGSVGSRTNWSSSASNEEVYHSVSLRQVFSVFILGMMFDNLLNDTDRCLVDYVKVPCT